MMTHSEKYVGAGRQTNSNHITFLMISCTVFQLKLSGIAPGYGLEDRRFECR
jgi:hypothetical protein